MAGLLVEIKRFAHWKKNEHTQQQNNKKNK